MQLKSIITVLLLITIAHVTSCSQTRFGYQVHVESAEDEPIRGAKVTVYIANQPAISYITDSNGDAFIELDSSTADKVARIVVEATGYETHNKYINLREDVLPYIAQLELLSDSTTTPESDTNPTSTSVSPPLVVTPEATITNSPPIVFQPTEEPTEPTPDISSTPEPPVGLCDEINSAIFDDFSDPNSGWSIDASEISESAYDNGELHISVFEAKTGRSSPRDECYYNFDLEVDVRRGSDSDGGYASIRFGIISETYYELDIYTEDDSGVQLWRVVSGRSAEKMTNLLGTSVVNLFEETNRIRLVFTNGKLQIYVNDKFVGNAFIEPRWGKIALSGCTCNIEEGKADFYFDNYSIQPVFQ